VTRLRARRLEDISLLSIAAVSVLEAHAAYYVILHRDSFSEVNARNVKF
jgi:hypothetical protein